MTREIYLAKSINHEHSKKNRWVVYLSNGETIYEDAHPKLGPAWERLSNYVKENDLDIISLEAEIAGCTVNLPPKQDGYIQYKRVIATGSWSRIGMCVGFVQGNKAKIFIVGEDKSSRSIIVEDPGEPKTIYNKSRR